MAGRLFAGMFVMLLSVFFGAVFIAVALRKKGEV